MARSFRAACGAAVLVGSFVLSMTAPAAGVDNPWSPAPSMATARADHTATLLENGEVLVAGGTGGGSINPLATAELYDPATNTWLRAASMRSGHDGATATLLGNGRVLVAGSFVTASAKADIYDPAMNKWFVAAPMADDRSFHTATLLGNGKVLVAGGYSFPERDVASAELYDPA